jgi:flagellar biosynthetic protein FlhB
VTKRVLEDPIFHSSVNLARSAGFMADSAFRIILQAAVALVVIAAVDYGWQFWNTSQDLKMTKQEVKDESKHTEGNPLVKAQQRRRRHAMTKRKMLAAVPRKTMKAPVIVAKGSRLNALRIREIAKEYQVPIVENKPLARLMFKYGRVGGEIPAQFYSVVAEVLAWVYRVNAYRYYREQSLSELLTAKP